MLEIKFRFPEKKDAEKFNEMVCGFFQGSKVFIENDIVVGPVYTSWKKNKQNHCFELTFADESIDRSITIEGAELTILKIKKIWGFVEESKETEKS